MSEIRDIHAEMEHPAIIVDSCPADVDELILERNMLKAVFECMGDAVYYTDPERRILGWNKVAEEMTGYTGQEVLGLYCRDILNHTGHDGESLCDSGCPLISCTAKRSTVIFDEVWLKRKNGRRMPVEVSCASVIDTGGNLIGMVEVFRDRTRQLELMHMKEEFTAAITHDLKSPITAIMGFTDLLADPRFGEISEKKIEYAKLIRQSNLMLLNLVGNIVDSARIEVGQMNFSFEEVQLNDMLKELTDTFLPLAVKGGITIEYSCPENTWIHADRMKLMQVFHNLISNSLRFTPRGGAIRVTAEDTCDRIVFTVKDTGRGIPKEEQGKIFQKFVQIKGGHRGTGLGLYIVKNIIKGHDSDITFNSEPGKGTSFFFSIVKGSPPVREEIRKGTILFVGEDSESARLIRLALSNEGHNLEHSVSGMEGLLKMEQLKPDLVLLHRPLPDMAVDDFEYALHTNARIKNTPVILLASIHLPEWDRKFSRIVLLPINLGLLKEAVQGALSIKRD